MAAKTNAVKKAEAYALKKASDVKDYVLPLAPGSQKQLEELCEREGFEDWREALTLMIKNTHEGRAPFEVPRHQTAPSEKMLKHLIKTGQLSEVFT